MSIKLGIVMDAIDSLHYHKDSTLAMLWEAKRRAYNLYYFQVQDLFLHKGLPYGHAKPLQVFENEKRWFDLEPAQVMKLADLDILLMRKDPPFNQSYLYTTYILEHAERLGVLVANRPQSLRDANEKLFTSYFSQCCANTLVSCSVEDLKAFWRQEQDIVCKPLDVMGGQSIFRLQQDEVNTNAILHALTQNGSLPIMAQTYIPEIIDGDKRIIMIDGKPLPFALARVPQGDDWRGNLVLGAKGIVQPLSERDKWICSQIGPELQKRGLYFVGLDVIGDYLTEINVTSPTGIRELQAHTSINIPALFLDTLEKYL